MKKDKRNILILILIIVIIVLLSYFIFSSGITSKLSASVNGIDDDTIGIDNYPVISFVVNSSGEKYVNTDIAVTVNASSNCNIAKLEYSFDLENWKTIGENFNEKKINQKITFSKTMNEKLYIRVINEKGYESYAYETVIKIDKKNPSLQITSDNNSIIINTKDNVSLSSVQYSNDLMSWDEESISGEKIILRKENFSYKYVRVVDSVGNISEVKKIEE